MPCLLDVHAFFTMFLTSTITVNYTLIEPLAGPLYSFLATVLEARTIPLFSLYSFFFRSCECVSGESSCQDEIIFFSCATDVLGFQRERYTSKLIPLPVAA